MARRQPSPMVTALIEQILRESYDGTPGEELDPLFSGRIVCACPFCATALATYNPTTYRFTCIRCTHKGGRVWWQLAEQLGIELPQEGS